MTSEEQKLIHQIEAKPGFEVIRPRHGFSVTIVQKVGKGLKLYSIWLGRSFTIGRLTQTTQS